MKRILQKLHIDGAIAFWVINRAWGSLAGLITIFVITRKLSIVEQGYYYTFSSLLAIQVLLDFGLGYALSQVIAYEHAIARDTYSDRELIKSAEQRLGDLLRFSAKWYATIAVLFFISASILGWLFFVKNPHNVIWKLPWLLTVTFFCFNILLAPIFSFLEGMQRVADSVATRTIQDLVAYSVLWIALLFNFSLFAIPIFHCFRIISGLLWLLAKKHIQSLQLLWISEKAKQRISWKKEIFPFQWRIAISTMSGYAVFYLFPPTLFAYQGAGEAGKVGMTIAIFSGLSAVSMAWLNTKIPKFCEHIAKREFSSLNDLHQIAFNMTLKVSGLLIVSAMLTIEVASYFHLRVAERVFTGLPLLFLGLSSFATQVNFSCAAYVRAFKEEPFLNLSIYMCVLTCPVIVGLAKYGGATFATAGYAWLTLFLAMPITWRIFLAKRRYIEALILAPNEHATRDQVMVLKSTKL